MAPIMFGALAPLQYALEAGKLNDYLNGAGKVPSSRPAGALMNGTANSDTGGIALNYASPTYLELFMALLTSALLALGLNVAEMMLVEATSALTLNIANTAKFAAIILLSVVLFSTQLSFLRMIGIALCIAGVGLFNIHKARIAKAKEVAASSSEDQAELELQPLLDSLDVAVRARPGTLDDSGTARANGMANGDDAPPLEEPKQ